MRSGMPRVSLHQSPLQAPPLTLILYPRRRMIPSTSPHHASTTMPATPQAPPYRPIRPSCRPLHASPRSSTKPRRLIARNIPPVSIRPVLGAAAVRWHRIAACSPRPKGHRTTCPLAMKTSRCLHAHTLEAHPRALIDRLRASLKRQYLRQRPRHLPNHPPI
jgi:hypothetical protein